MWFTLLMPACMNTVTFDDLASDFDTFHADVGIRVLQKVLVFKLETYRPIMLALTMKK